MLDKLTDLYYSKLSERYPSFPKSYHPNPKFCDTTANGLTRCVIQFLNLSGHQAERISSAGRVIGREKQVIDVLGQRRIIGSSTYIKGTTTNGTADISGIVKCNSGKVVPVKIEIKIKKDKQSKAQIEYQKSIEAVGGLYWIVKDLEQFGVLYHLLVND